MSSIGTGVSIVQPCGVLHVIPLPHAYIYVQYDLSAAQFSPDGRVFQIEYANKAVENSG